MVFPPDVSNILADGSLLAARLAEHVDHTPWRTCGKAIARDLFVAAWEEARTN
jgi:hypothetical protein